MEKAVVIKASEQEILDIINEHFGTDEDSIVALEELGNQDWVVDVRAIEDDPDYFLAISKRTGKPYIKNYYVGEVLNHLCFLGKLEAGEYVIDCTW